MYRSFADTRSLENYTPVVAPLTTTNLHIKTAYKKQSHHTLRTFRRGWEAGSQNDGRGV